MKKIDLSNIETYYFYRNKFDKSLMGRMTHKQRLWLHPILFKIISSRNKKAGFITHLLYDKRKKTNKPIIFAITHIGKFDIEVATETVKDHYYLLSGDYENMRGTIEEVFLGLNGVVYIREDDKADRALSKEKMINVLRQGGNMMYFPEGTWNLTTNLPVLPCPFGIIEVAMRSNAIILPIGIQQYDKDFYIAVGENFDVSQYSNNSVEDKIIAVNNLRDRLATLKWDIWSSIPQELSDSINRETFNTQLSERLQEWPGMTLEQFLDSGYKPKNVVSYKQAFAHLENVVPNLKTAFLFNKRLK